MVLHNPDSDYCPACLTTFSGEVTVTMTWSGFPLSKALNGMSMQLHARCVRFVIHDREVDLPPRISDPFAEVEEPAA